MKEKKTRGKKYDKKITRIRVAGMQTKRKKRKKENRNQARKSKDEYTRWNGKGEKRPDKTK